MTANGQLINLYQEPPALSGKYVGTFAHKVLTVNLPSILDRVIVSMKAHLEELPVQLGILDKSDAHRARGESSQIVAHLEALKTELLEDRPLKPITGNLHDRNLWNTILAQEEELQGGRGRVTYLSVKWLLAECYLYRRMREILRESQFFRNFYFFYTFKEEAFYVSKDFANTLATHLLKCQDKLIHAAASTKRHLFSFYIMTSLWGNKCDLSLSCGEQYTDLAFDFRALESKILVNDFIPLWDYIQTLSDLSESRPLRIDIVLDNASYELFTDLCMVEFFHLSGLLPRTRTQVHWHVKACPWFVSDANRKDFTWLLEIIRDNPDFLPEIKQIDTQFLNNIASGLWIIDETEFWTLPCDYSQMPELGPDLYSTLNTSDLVIFKGDLNYRKLVGDLSWAPEVPFSVALRNFKPNTAICSLRTVKADVVVGVTRPETLELIHKLGKDLQWMETGEYAVIHFLNNRI